MEMIKKRVWGIICTVAGLIVIFSSLFTESDYFQIASIFIGVPLVGVGVALFLLTFQIPYNSISNSDSFPKHSVDERPEEYMADDLTSNLDNILKIFYNHDYTERIIFIKKRENLVIIDKEKLAFIRIDDYDGNSSSRVYGIWESYNCNHAGSIYDGIAAAMKDCEEELEDYVEKDLSFLFLNGNKKHIVSVKLNGFFVKMNSVIPHSTRYKVQIKTNKKGSDKKDAILIVMRDIGGHKRKAIMYFADENEGNDTLSIGTSFGIFESDVKFATGVVEDYYEIPGNTEK